MSGFSRAERFRGVLLGVTDGDRPHRSLRDLHYHYDFYDDDRHVLELGDFFLATLAMPVRRLRPVALLRVLRLWLRVARPAPGCARRGRYSSL